MEIVGSGTGAPSQILLGEGAPNVNYYWVPTATEVIDEGGYCVSGSRLFHGPYMATGEDKQCGLVGALGYRGPEVVGCVWFM